MRRRLAVIVLATVGLLALPTSAVGAEQVDQQQLIYDGFAGNSTACWAQTFTAGVTGRLTKVSLYVRKLTDHPIMAIQIRDVTESAPGGTTLASTTVLGADIASTFGWIDFAFADPPIVFSGTMYSIVAPPLGPMGPDPDPWGFEWGGASETVSLDPYPNGLGLTSSTCDGPFGDPSKDLAFQTYVDTEGAYKPDGRIRVNHGSWIGGNTYNTTGVEQSRSGEASPGNKVLFRISVQNDGFVSDRFTVDADGAATPGYRVRYFHGTTEITHALKDGTYQTRVLGPGRRFTIEAWVSVRSNAAPASEVTRLISIKSVGDPTKVDAVEFRASRR